MQNMVCMIGLFATLIIIVGLSIWSGTKGKKAQNNNSLLVVSGVIIGTLVGGSSTVGTAQLAFNYGMSAWWFTLGGGISCLVLAVFYVIPLRHSGCRTLVQMISKEFGPTAGMASSILSSVGTFINVISQIISATAVIAVIFPFISIELAVFIAAVFMIIYVFFGGVKGAGIVGIVKTILLYVAMMACGLMVLTIVGGVSPFVNMVQKIDNPEGIHFFSLFARGVGTDLGAGISLLLGVLTTQTYAQAVLSAKSDQAGRGGALLSAFLIPPIGIGGILVGLYMRANAAMYPGITAKTALTTFVMTNMPPILSGIILGALFIATVGTGAGLALGISTVINNDIVKNLSKKALDTEKLSKIWIILILGGAALLSTGKLGDTILKFAFMSMGLRGAVIFVPLLFALWLRGKVDRKFAVASIIISPLLVLIFNIIPVFSFDALFVGIIGSFIIMFLGMLIKKNRN